MVMTVECPSCASTFPVDPRKVPEGGVNARCTQCSEVFRVERPATEIPEPEQAREAPAAEPEAVEPTEAPAAASVPGEPPATQADTESVVDAPEPDLEAPGEPVDAEVEDVTGDEMEPEPEPLAGSGAEAATEGDWEAWSAPTTEEGEEEGEPREPSTSGPDTDGTEVTASTPIGGGGNGAGWGTPPDAGITTEVERPEAPHEPDADAPDPAGESAGATLEEAAEARDWVFETEDTPPSPGAYELEADREPAAGGDLAAEESESSDEPSETEVVSGSGEGEAAFEVSWGSGAADAPEEPATGAGESEEPEEEPAPSGEIQGFSFGRRDPAEKARRLARVLVSDMIMYNPDRHQQALENGTLEADFEDEIAKSWKEYVEQVGEEMARSTDYWRAALNDILAKGEEIF